MYYTTGMLKIIWIYKNNFVSLQNKTTKIAVWDFSELFIST